MDKDYAKKRFDDILQYLPETLRAELSVLNDEVKAAAQEIRLRAGRPLAVTVNGTQLFVRSGSTSLLPREDCKPVSQTQINDCFLRLCNHSVYSHNDELCNGFVILAGGHRAGICGTVSLSGGSIETMRDISSVNLRIAKEVPSCADSLVQQYTGGGVLVCGGPGSGKTTLIRDMARQLANGAAGRCLKVAVIDSRGELAAAWRGVPMTDIGSTTDVITACPKGKGIEMALRTLYPDVIVFDELGDMDEVAAVEQSLHSGVSVITSAHIGTLGDLYRRQQTKRIIEIGAIDTVVMCSSQNGFSYSVYDIKELRSIRMQAVMK